MEDAWSVPAVWPAGIFFFSVPLDGTVLFFSVLVSAGDPDGLVGQKGGPSGPPYQGGGLPQSLQV